MAGTTKLRATSKGEQVLRRQRSIVGYLASSDRPKTTREVRIGLGLEAKSLRTLQRDLEALRMAGAVDLLEHGWAAIGNRIEEELDRLLSIAAIEVFDRALGPTLPTSLQRGVTALLDKRRWANLAKLKLKPEESNWLQALKIEPGYGWMHTPIIDRSVRAGIESAILSRRKAWVGTVRQESAVKCNAAGEALVSISHFLMLLPDRPAIVVWPSDESQGLKSLSNARDFYRVWPLEWIQSVRVTNEPAEPREWTSSCHKQPDGRSRPDQDWTRYVLKISPWLIEQMTGTVFLKCLTEPALGGGLIGRDPKGWGVYRLAAPLEKPQPLERFQYGLAAFLERHAEDIEIIEPVQLRLDARARAARILQMYSEAQGWDSTIAAAGQSPSDSP